MHGNKKGPENKGSKTGRGLGYCNGSENPGFESNETPMGMRRGNGRGPGRGMDSGFGRGAGVSGGFGRNMGRGQGFRGNNMESENAEIKARLDSIETLLKELKK